MTKKQQKKIYDQEYNRRNKAKKRTQRKSYRAKNKLRIQVYHKRYAKNNVEELKRKRRAYYLMHKAWMNEQSRRYYKNHTEKRKTQTAKYRAAQCKASPLLRLMYNARARTSFAISRSRADRSDRFRQLLGCSGEELGKFISKKFKRGMSWKNYGKNGWVLDHKKPCAVFDLTDPEQRRQCFHYTNLQPLWADENLKKSAKWEPDSN